MNEVQVNTAQMGKAIYCDCYINEYSRYRILGSITSEGIIEILRAHKEKTIIQTAEFLISCHDCGYKRYFRLNYNYV